VRDQDLIVSEFPALALGSDGIQRDAVLIVGHDVVHFEAQRATRELKETAKEPKHLIYALVVAGDLAPAGRVVTDVLGEVLALQRRQVAALKCRESFPQQLFIRMRHLISPCAMVSNHSPGGQTQRQHLARVRPRGISPRLVAEPNARIAEPGERKGPGAGTPRSLCTNKLGAVSTGRNTDQDRKFWQFGGDDKRMLCIAFLGTVASGVALVLIVGFGLLEAHLIHRYRHELTGLAFSQLGLLLGLPASLALLAMAVPALTKGVKIIALAYAALLITVVILGLVGYAAGIR
jgi:hypothetical protein